jgi:hypothetical protein
MKTIGIVVVAALRRAYRGRASEGNNDVHLTSDQIGGHRR